MAELVALAPDLFFASKIEATLTAAGHRVKLETSVDGALRCADQAQAVIVDLHAEQLDPGHLVAALQGKRLLGFYSHVDAEAREKAEQAGFDLVVPRSRMAREMPALVARLLGSGT